MEKIKCVACQGSRIVFWQQKKNVHGVYHIHKCLDCLSAFCWPRPSSEQIEEYYRNITYHPFTPPEAIKLDNSYYPTAVQEARRILSICRSLSKGTRFLDAGAGFGTFSKVAVDFGFEVVACEPNPNSRRIFRDLTGFEAEASMFDTNFVIKNNNSFDVVLLSHVLEHSFDPASLVNNLFQVLRPGGIAAISVPFYGSFVSKVQGKKDMFISPPEHLNYFSKTGLESLLKSSSLFPEKILTVSKIPKTKYFEMIKLPILLKLSWRTFYYFLALWDIFGLGMVVLAFFRKPSLST